MQLSDTAIQEYIQLYREDFGEELSVGEALAIATRLVTLYALLCRPLPAENVPEAQPYAEPISTSSTSAAERPSPPPSAPRGSG